MCERLSANGQKMKVKDNYACTDDGYNSLEYFMEIENIDSKWVISETAYNKKKCLREFFNEEDACISLFLQLFARIVSKEKGNKYLNATRAINIFPTTIEEVKSLLASANYPIKYISFEQKNALKDCFYIKGENNSNGYIYYYGRYNSITRITKEHIFAPYHIFSLPYLRDEEEILLKQGLLKEPLSDENVVRFIKNNFTY
jgi:hypothetical protein